MKRSIKIGCFIVILMMSIKLSYASETPKVDITPLLGKNAVLQITDMPETSLEITIKNKTGEVIYYSETESDSAGYQNVFDFSEYKPGVYDLIVSNGAIVTEREFTVAGSMVNVGNMQLNNKPFFAYSDTDQIVRVTYLNYPGEKVKLKVYDGNELIFNKALDNSFSVNQGLNLSYLAAGQYQIVLAAGSENFNYPVVIR